MNPLVSPKFAGRVFMALAAIAGIIFSAGCGNSAPAANNGGFSNSNLTGTYVFSTTGTDSENGIFFAVAGAFVANGTGGVTGGSIDVVGPDVQPGSPIALPIAANSSYSVGTDGRGHATLGTSLGNIVIAFVLTSSSHGLVTEFDGNGTGSGTIDLQTALTGISQLAGPYAFSMAGSDGNGTPFATIGSFTLDSNGNVTSGVQDFNDGGIPYVKQNLTGSAALGSGTGPGSITLSSAFGPLTFDFYPVDTTHMKFIETDYNQFLAGDAFTQTGASIPNGPMVFTMSGGVSAPISVGGVMVSDGTGNFSAGLEDVNNNGTVSGAQVPFSGTESSGGSVGSRVIVNLTGFVPASQLAIYPSTAGLLLLETDSQTVTVGTALAQSSTTIGSTQGYGFNLSAFNTDLGVEEDDNAQFTTNSTGFSGIVDVNDDGTLSPNQAFAGTITAPDGTGRGAATTTANGSGFVSFNFYVASESTILLLETDSNQIGTGLFETQTTPAAAAQSSAAMLRAAIRSHGALKHKAKKK